MSPIRTEISALPTNANGRRTIIEQHIDANTAALEAGLLGVGQSLFSAAGIIGVPSYAVTGMDFNTNFVAGVSAELGTLAVVTAQMVTVPQNDIWYRVAIRPGGDPVDYGFFDQSTNQMLTHTLKGLPYKIVLIEGDNTNPPPCPSDYVDYGTIFATGGIANFTLSPARAILAPNSPWANILGTPTTLAGYGITNAYTIAQTDTLLANKTDKFTLTGRTQYDAGTTLDGFYFNTTAGLPMWSVVMNGTPSGITAPTLDIRRHDAAGALLGSPVLSINRQTGYQFAFVDAAAPFFAAFSNGSQSVTLGKNTTFSLPTGVFSVSSATITTQATGNTSIQSTAGNVSINATTGLTIGTTATGAITNFNGSIVRFNILDQLDLILDSNTVRIRPTYTEFPTIGGYGGTLPLIVTNGGTATIPNTNSATQVEITVDNGGADAAITVDLAVRGNGDGSMQYISFRGNFATLTVTWASPNQWVDNITPPTTYRAGDGVFLRANTQNAIFARRRWSILAAYRTVPATSATGTTQTSTLTSGTISVTSGVTLARIVGASFSGTVAMPTVGVVDRATCTVVFGATGTGAGFGTLLWSGIIGAAPSGVFDGSAVSFIFDLASAKWRLVGVA